MGRKTDDRCGRDRDDGDRDDRIDREDRNG